MISKYIPLDPNWFRLQPASMFASRNTGEQTGATAQQQSSTDTTSKEQAGKGPDAGSDAETVSSSEPTTSLPLDQVFEILKNRRRRLVLHYLDEHGGESSLSDLAEHIAAIENDTTVKAISSTQRKRVYVGLYQCHLPKMDDMNIIDFDQNRGTVVQESNAEQVKSYLGEPDERAWYKLYLGLSLAAAALFGIAQLGAQQYGLTPSLVLVLFLLGVAGVGIAQAYDGDSLLPADSD